MNLNNGLPLPGRELDATVWGILGYEVTWWWSYQGHDGTWHRPEGPYSADTQTESLPKWVQTDIRSGRITGEPWYNKHGRVNVVPAVSTTHAFFQVMEGMRKHDRQFRHSLYANDNAVDILVWDKNFLETRKLWNVEVEIADYPSREHAYAHAVCACAWKVGQNE